MATHSALKIKSLTQQEDWIKHVNRIMENHFICITNLSSNHTAGRQEDITSLVKPDMSGE